MSRRSGRARRGERVYDCDELEELFEEEDERRLHSRGLDQILATQSAAQYLEAARHRGCRWAHETDMEPAGDLNASDDE